MRVVKVTKSLLKKAPAEFLASVGAVDQATKVAFPFCVYMAEKDFDTLFKNFRKFVDKEFKGFTKDYRKKVVSAENLNFGPEECLKNIIKKGYILVDDEAITRGLEANKKALK